MNKLKNLVIASILILGFITMVSAQPKEKIFGLYLTVYRNDNVELIEFKESVGVPTIFTDVGIKDYTIKIISFDGEVLYQESFTISFIAYPYPADPENPPPEVILEKKDVYWRLPYFEDASKIQLFHNDNLIFEYVIRLAEPQHPKKEGIPIFYIILGLILVIGIGILIWSIYRRSKESGQATRLTYLMR